jgi:predicted nucleic acid-binding protein
VIVLDTNVISEFFNSRPSEKVLLWLAAQRTEEVFVSAITQSEILYGVEILPAGKRRSRLSEAADRIFAEEFAGRILPFDSGAARQFTNIVATRKAAGRPISQPDAMIAAVTRSQRAALATRNTADFELCGISLINPWTV